MNCVHLIGRITNTIEVKQTPNGVSYASFILAVNRSYKDENGEQPTDFIRCIVWRNIAENLSKLTAKGSMIGIEGTINTRNYQNQAGYTVYQTDVVVNRFFLVENKAQTEQRRKQETNSRNQSGNATDETYEVIEGNETYYDYEPDYNEYGISQADIINSLSDNDNSLPF